MASTTRPDERSRAEGALWGEFIGDALAMPVHWYYDRHALQRDYGEVRDYLEPRNPHPGSILHRSHYEPPSAKGEILHDEAQYWGRHGIHYHQHLAAGENTLNLKLARLLLESLAERGEYDADDYLDRMIRFMTTPGSHRDTYVEEFLRGFFDRYARGADPHDCGIVEKHIGGLAGTVPLLVHYRRDHARARRAAAEHLELTHRGALMASGLEALASVLLPVLAGERLRDVLERSIEARRHPLFAHPYARWLLQDDLEVIGREVAPSCYIEESVPGVLYLALKYHDDPEAALVANTMCGGDNCYRGAALGALLGAENGLGGWPQRWRDGLVEPPFLPEARARVDSGG
jgi:ADP-ribosylglycohydrolase